MTPNFPYPKGSIWRKWDLQTQTILDDNYVPLSDYAEELKSADPTRWQQYVAKVGGEENAVLYDSKVYFNDVRVDKGERCRNYVRNLFAFLEVYNPELACIGITDHNYFDDSLLDVIIDYARDAHCKVVPGVEINCGGVHMLLFFSTALYDRPTFSQGIHAFLIKFGINNRTDVGGVLTTTSSDHKEILDEVKACGGIVIYPHCNSNNGLFQERGATDRTHLADIFNHQKMNLLQSRHHQASMTVAEYIRGNDALKAKFCTHISSDARSLRDYGRADQDGNYLWIKADPTFEGLRQIVFEPEQRIFVAPGNPEAKKPYFVIDQLRFLDNTSDVKFSSDPIEVNENLTTIIGGKSTGKSLLLYYMAKTIDRSEVKDRSLMTGLSVGYDFDDNLDFNFEVTWKDGQRSLLKVLEGAPEGESRERKILYIPQKYLNTLSEENIKSRDALNQFVLSVILEDPSVAEQYADTQSQMSALMKSIQLDIGQLFADTDDIRKTEEELKQAGDEKGIAKYIETLQREVSEIEAQSGFTGEQIKQYDGLTSREKEIAARVSNLENDKKTIKTLQSTLTGRLGELRSTADEYHAYLNDPDVKANFRAEFAVLGSFEPAARAVSDKLTADIDAKLGTLDGELTSIKADLAPLFTKVQMRSDLQTKSDAIKLEQQKQTEIEIKRKSVSIKRDSYKKKAETILESYGQVIAQYEDLRNEFKKFESRFGDISLSVRVGYDDDAFNADVVDEYINKINLKKAMPEAEWGQEFVYQYDPNKHTANVRTVFEGLLGGTISTLKNRPVRDAVTKLLGDYFFIDFRIFYKNDSLDKMSPGKKGLVLLQLLINLSNEEWPILLDQPEDDLDNRSVYDDLVAFLKMKKLQRQIVIVTHNPNLVVGADAEEVIVANQAGQEVGRDNRKHRFEYVSEALENSFELDEGQEPAILFRKGIRQHVCEILEGGKEAFQKREQKYSFSEE